MIACIVQAYYLSLNTVRNDQTCMPLYPELCDYADVPQSSPQWLYFGSGNVPYYRQSCHWLLIICVHYSINSNVMVIVGNIPPLAALYKRFIGGPASRETDWSSNQQYSFKLKANHNRINSSQDSNVVIIEAPVGARTRTSSEEYIVDAPGQYREEGSRIERRTDISVTYDAT